MQTMHQRLAAFAAGLLLAATAGAADANANANGNWHWVASWGSAQMIPEGQNELPQEHWRDSTLRQVVRVALGGEKLRVRISNTFGTTPMVVEAAGIGLAKAPGSPDIDPQSAKALTFGGRPSVMIPAGAEYYSDVVALPHKAGADLAISLYFNGAPSKQTGHPGSRTTSFVAKGQRTLDAAWSNAEKITRWYMLSDVEVQAPRDVGAVVAVGDSITDGYGTTTDGNDRWPDVLAGRIQRSGKAMGVVNVGIGGGRMLRDGLGPNLASRFDRDVIGRAGATHAVVMIGVNDFGSQRRSGEDIPAARAKLVEDLQLAHRQLVERAHAHGICVIGGTVTPYAGSDYYRPSAANEADRQQLNAWIRKSGVFDAVADFDAALRDPQQPDRLKKEYDNDGLHPSIAGLRAMAEAIPLKALQARCGAAK
ncbi:SGNH/GDSL hydrolase family protein [Massilia sp. METH4]|uniref:SGNH/GDSL hydrolase family protein n=1 Tax=Massilia sp. METH4 TaxID=3123041 RepID=UPI0030CADE6C